MMFSHISFSVEWVLCESHAMSAFATFPVPFAMGFTDSLAVYRVVGSERCPDAESLTVMLMRESFVGVPVRMRSDEPWFFLTWQRLDHIQTTTGMRFEGVTARLSIVG